MYGIYANIGGRLMVNTWILWDNMVNYGDMDWYFMGMFMINCVFEVFPVGL